MSVSQSVIQVIARSRGAMLRDAAGVGALALMLAAALHAPALF